MFNGFHPGHTVIVAPFVIIKKFPLSYKLRFCVWMRWHTAGLLNMFWKFAFQKLRDCSGGAEACVWVTSGSVWCRAFPLEHFSLKRPAGWQCVLRTVLERITVLNLVFHWRRSPRTCAGPGPPWSPHTDGLSPVTVPGPAASSLPGVSASGGRTSTCQRDRGPPGDRWGWARDRRHRYAAGFMLRSGRVGEMQWQVFLLILIQC